MSQVRDERDKMVKIPSDIRISENLQKDNAFLDKVVILLSKKSNVLLLKKPNK